MLGVGGSEVVMTVECGTRAEIDIVVFLEVEHTVDRSNRRHTDRRGGQPLIFISVVGRIDAQVLVEDSTQCEITHGILYGRVGLQGHTLIQSVDVNACYRGHFVRCAGLFIDNRRQRHHLQTRQSAALAFGVAVGPKCLRLLLHSLDNLLGRYGPIEFVGVGDKHREHRQRVFVAIFFSDLLIGQHRSDLDRIGIDLTGELAGQLGGRFGIVECNVDGCLHTELDHSHDLDHAHSLVENVVPRLVGLLQIEAFGIDVECQVVSDFGFDRIE